MIRAFVALPLPDRIRSDLAMVQHMLPLATQVPPENFHLTLVFLGEQPDEVLELVHDGLSALRAAPLTLRIEGLGTFGGEKPRVIHAAVAPDPALEHLRARVARAAVAAGVTPDHRRFVPHVTLSRARPRGADLMRLEQAVAQLDGFRAGPFEVDRMILYRSTLRPGAPVYDPLAVYPLTA